MSTFATETHKCAVCENESQHRVICGTHSIGSPDLDLRPAEMQRSTMWCWVEECPVCGYVSDQVDDITSITKEFLETPAYKSCNGIAFKSKQAVLFYRQYLICVSDNRWRDAFFAILYAAWACDDVNDHENAVICRQESLPILSKVIKGRPKDKAELKVLKMDVLRRAGMFDDVRAEFGKIFFWRKTLNEIVSFQLYLCEKGDTGCYRITDAEDYANEKSKGKNRLKRFLDILKR